MMPLLGSSSSPGQLHNQELLQPLSAPATQRKPKQNLKAQNVKLTKEDIDEINNQLRSLELTAAAH